MSDNVRPAERFDPATLLERIDDRHPRIIFTPEREQELKDQLAGGDPILAKCLRDVLAEADEVFTLPPVECKLEMGRLVWVAGECVRRIYALGVAWRISGEPKYLDGLIDILLTISDFHYWNHPHFLDIGEMTHAVGVGYDWAYPEMTPDQRNTVRTAIVEKALVHGVACFDNPDAKNAWFIHSEYNWNQVCNAGLIVGSLAVAEDHPDLARRLLAESLESIPRAIATYAPDGTWGEGPSYWNYGMSYTIVAIEALRTALGSDFGLSQIPGLEKTGRAHLLMPGPTGRPMNYGDVDIDTPPFHHEPMWSLLWLARNFDDDLAAAHEHEVLQARPAKPQHLIWYAPPAEAPELPLDVHLGGNVEVASFRSSREDADALWVGVKGGFNRVNHAHLDLGNFELDALGLRWVLDLGKDTYALPGYWKKGEGGQRWTHFRLGSDSHNVIQIEDDQQRVDGAAKFVAYDSRNEQASVVIDVTGAYQPHVSRALRGVRMLPGRRAVLVQDELELVKPARVAWNLLTEADVAISGRTVTLTREGKSLTLRILSPDSATIETVDIALEPPAGSTEAFTKLVARVKAGEGPFRIAALLSPDWPDAQTVESAEVLPLEDWPGWL